MVIMDRRKFLMSLVLAPIAGAVTRGVSGKIINEPSQQYAFIDLGGTRETVLTAGVKKADRFYQIWTKRKTWTGAEILIHLDQLFSNHPKIILYATQPTVLQMTFWQEIVRSRQWGSQIFIVHDNELSGSIVARDWVRLSLEALKTTTAFRRIHFVIQPKLIPKHVG